MSFFARLRAATIAAMTCGLLTGCANPGPPKPPSLQIPAAATKISAKRSGYIVELQFTLPTETTDGVSLRPGKMKAELCRAVDSGTCVPLPGSVTVLQIPTAPKTLAQLRDVLPATLAEGTSHLLTYRVQLSNAQGKSGAYSEPVYAAAGAAPARVEGLQAQGSRLGVVLTWQQATSSDTDAEVLLDRVDIGAHMIITPKPAHDSAHGTKSLSGAGKNKIPPGRVLLNAAGEDNAHDNADKGATLDTTAQAEVPYRYMAERRRSVEISGHKLEIWSGESTPLVFKLHDTFPPPVPRDLSIAGFMEAQTDGKQAFAVDLIWEPVQDDQLAGYRVYRREEGSIASEKVLLTSMPVKLPAFHDTTASVSKRYRYSVTSIDLKGNESDAVTGLLEPQTP